jgi:hypothetical protein
MAFDRSRTPESKLAAIARRNARLGKRVAQAAAMEPEPRENARKTDRSNSRKR